MATSGECLKIWKISDNKEVSLELNLKNVPSLFFRITIFQLHSPPSTGTPNSPT